VNFFKHVYEAAHHFHLTKNKKHSQENQSRL